MLRFFFPDFFAKKYEENAGIISAEKTFVFLFFEVSIQIPDPAVKDLSELVTEIIYDLFHKSIRTGQRIILFKVIRVPCHSLIK